jgi:hypothetical protein
MKLFHTRKPIQVLAQNQAVFHQEENSCPLFLKFYLVSIFFEPQNVPTQLLLLWKYQPHFSIDLENMIKKRRRIQGSIAKEHTKNPFQILSHNKTAHVFRRRRENCTTFSKS